VKPSLLWWLSCKAYQRKLVFVARLLKAINFLVFHAILPYQAEIEKDIKLEHYGLGVVVHPNVKIGEPCQHLSSCNPGNRNLDRFGL
jgi:serine acetyltransferase